MERLDLDLGVGMTVFTGETGAGKSIVVDAPTYPGEIDRPESIKGG